MKTAFLFRTIVAEEEDVFICDYRWQVLGVDEFGWEVGEGVADLDTDSMVRFDCFRKIGIIFIPSEALYRPQIRKTCFLAAARWY